jgi:serine/threonine-protein kinase
MLLGEVHELTRRVVDLRTESMGEQHKLEEIDVRGRERRAQLGFAVDQLGVDASKAKEDVRTAQDALKRIDEDVARAKEAFLEAHKEVLYWEGRSGFAEPWPDLARAYHAVGRRVEEWNVLRQEERAKQELVEAASRMAADLDFQIRELRTALANHEQNLDDERAKCQERIEAQSKDADAVERRLFELTTRFCKPLRARPELAPLFKELETEAA